MKKIAIIGCGWLGIRLAKRLSNHFEIYTTVTQQDKAEILNSNNFNPTIIKFQDNKTSQTIIPWPIISSLDIIIITIPISNKRSTSKALHHRINHLSSFIGHFHGQMFAMSSTSVYPDITKEFIEDDIPFENIFGEQLLREKYPQINIMRLAGLMGDNRQLSNYQIRNLASPVNYIHYHDISGVIEKMIEYQSNSRIYNIVAPIHPSKAEIIDIQQNHNSYSTNNTYEGRIISSLKLIKELNYIFQYPDPRYFHL